MDTPPDVAKKTRISLHRVQRRLSYSSDMLPSAIKVKGVQCPDNRTYGTGGFADVFRGVYGKEDVALKRLRIFTMLEESKKDSIRKVHFISF